MPPPLKNSVSKGFYIMPHHFRSQRQSCHYIHCNDLTTYIKKPLKRFPMLSGRNLRAQIVKALNSLSRFIRPTYVFIHPPHFLSVLHIKLMILLCFHSERTQVNISNGRTCMSKNKPLWACMFPPQWSCTEIA